MDKIVNIQNLDPNTLQLQNYSTQDESLITNNTVDVTFNATEDYVEYFIFDLSDNILFSNVEGYGGFRLVDNNVTIDPQFNLEREGYTEGQYKTLYNFLKRKINSSPDNPFFIQDISADRTELRLNTAKISNSDVINLTSQFANEIANASGSYVDFALNFGNNNIVIATNIALETTNPNDPTVLIKLYEALPSDFTQNSACWIVEQIAESQAYQIELNTIFEAIEESNQLSGPNYNINIMDQINNSTPYYNQNTLNQNYSALGSGSLLYQINSLLAEKGIEINIDYSDYSQFIHFSSAQTRLENFYYKLSLIETYNFSASYSTGTSNTFVSSSAIAWQNKINDIITNFDGYEYYLYYESSSTAWPKINTEPPYINASTTDPNAIAWLVGQLDSASYFDLENKDNLLNTIPDYLREDDTNEQYFLFTQMIGQHFDNVWIYLKDVTNKFDADNRLNYGISKDIVAQAIRDLGVKIYQNNFSSENLYSALLGITPSGSLFNIAGITNSLPVPTGLEYINTIVTASSTSSVIPLDDVNKETYKKIYHNLPLLLKKKGTVDGINVLANTFGVPDTLLHVREFGSKSTLSGSYDNYIATSNYSFTSTNPSSPAYINTTFDTIPATISFRFKPQEIPSTTYSQLLAYSSNTFAITLNYQPIPTGSYSGSISSPYNMYGTLEFINMSTLLSCNVSLPFFDGNWWTVTITVDGSNNNLLYAGSSNANGINFEATATETSLPFNTFTNPSDPVYFPYPSPLTINSNTYYPFLGSYQEIKFYAGFMSIQEFETLVLNPTYAPTNTFFRAPLGTDLNTPTQNPQVSTVPYITGFYTNYYLFGSFTFDATFGYTYQDEPVIGIKNDTAQRLRQTPLQLPPGNTLSQYQSVQQNYETSGSFTTNVNYVEVGFSPQGEINNDIISSLGFFNIGDYIGDPRNIISSSLTYYPPLNVLRDSYFSKYTHPYDVNDYIRLIKYYDNALFKMVKDFVPGRAGLASGIIIKPTYLERCRYPQPRATTYNIQTRVGSPTSQTLNIPY